MGPWSPFCCRGQMWPSYVAPHEELWNLRGRPSSGLYLGCSVCYTWTLAVRLPHFLGDPSVFLWVMVAGGLVELEPGGCRWTCARSVVGKSSSSSLTAYLHKCWPLGSLQGVFSIHRHLSPPMPRPLVPSPTVTFIPSYCLTQVCLLRFQQGHVLTDRLRGC